MFKIIDDQLNLWAKPKKLHIYTQYKDVEVRSIDIVTPKGNKYQLWLEICPKHIIEVCVWDYGKLSARYKTTYDIFTETLDIARDMISFWDGYK